jgi:hypothetical protein|tara:strand:- start:414 stop:527 length:114 start_codon:yes stop_codon:yes gene_type:complete
VVAVENKLVVDLVDLVAVEVVGQGLEQIQEVQVTHLL